MQILEEYQELIERDAAEISYLWKLVQMVFYLSCALSGYVCSILFYMIWEHAFQGNCPLWAKSVLMVTMELESKDDLYGMNLSYADWWKHVITDYEYGNKCETYFVTCFLSCIFGVMWFALFLMCGKGGHDTVIYEAPWRIVPPAMISNFILTIITTYTTFNMKVGYEEFSKNIKDVFLETYSTYKINDTSECEIIQMYVKMYNFHEHNVCYLFSWLQAFSGIMMWSWIAGLIILMLRVIVVNDFRICKVTIYEVPHNDILDNSNMDTAEESNDKRKKKKES